jgi:hypothetical protein
VRSYAALALLERVDAPRTAQLQAMADQVSYARLYGAGHLRSDLDAGAWLGTFMAEYELALEGITPDGNDLT